MTLQPIVGVTSAALLLALAACAAPAPVVDPPVDDPVVGDTSTCSDELIAGFTAMDEIFYGESATVEYVEVLPQDTALAEWSPEILDDPVLDGGCFMELIVSWPGGTVLGPDLYALLTSPIEEVTAAFVAAGWSEPDDLGSLHPPGDQEQNAYPMRFDAESNVLRLLVEASALDGVALAEQFPTYIPF